MAPKSSPSVKDGLLGKHDESKSKNGSGAVSVFIVPLSSVDLQELTGEIGSAGVGWLSSTLCNLLQCLQMSSIVFT